MIAIDTNILVYAHRRDSDFHLEAKRCITEQLEQGRLTAFPWPCLHEFISTVTHPRIFSKDPTPLATAFDQIRAWTERPYVALLCEPGAYLARLEQLATAGRIAGPMIHDARIAALCLEHGVTELWSADRDFSRFPELHVRNPLA